MMIRGSRLFFAAMLSTLFFSCGQKQWLTAEEEIDLYQVNRFSGDNKKMDQMIAPYKAQLDEQMNQVIGYVPKSLQKRRPEGSLGNWMADAIAVKGAEISGMDIAFGVQNYGGIRIPSLNKGDLTVGQIYELMPFDNYLVILKLTGEQVRQLLERVVADGGWPLSKEIKLTASNNKLSSVEISGEQLKDSKSYHIAILDYIANGGGDCDFLIDIPQIETGVLLRDVFISYAEDLTKAGKQIEADVEGRINMK